MAERPRKQTAETMATRQREISVSEFFAKNRHLLGFDNPRKALLTTVKEAVDNALDACEEAGILPDIEVRLVEVTPPPNATKPGRYRVTIIDNGPGIVRKQVENIFGKLLYGSKFHRMKMSRGQQGIGISAAGMYGLMTTGKPMVIITRPHPKKPAHHIELAMDTSKNKPEVTVDRETDADIRSSSGTGTSVTIELEARYVKGKASVDAYLEQTAIANPHAQFTFVPPEKAAYSEEGSDEETLLTGTDHDSAVATIELAHTTELADRIVFPRAVDELPPETEEIKPHPHGVELGTFLNMLKKTEEKQLAGFFKNEFCRVPPAVVNEITKIASGKGKGSGQGGTISGQTALKNLDHATAERLYAALQNAKLRSPPTNCLAPIGVRTMLAGLLKGVKAEFYAASMREPAVYRGNPFQIEAAIAFGGDLPGDQTARVIRFANRVPLLYQQSACCAFKAVTDTAWKNYGLQQPRGAAPVGPLVVMIHMASVWVPFTSESKEAIAEYDEIKKEMRLALQECGRKLGSYVRRRKAMKREGERRDVFERYIGEIAKACNAITGTDAKTLYDALQQQAQRRTELADAILDEDGKIIGSKSEQLADGNGRLDNDDGVIIVEHASASDTQKKPRTTSTASEDDLAEDDAPIDSRGKLKKSRPAADAGSSDVEVKPVGKSAGKSSAKTSSKSAPATTAQSGKKKTGKKKVGSKKARSRATADAALFE
jgi:DNA topoisomerase VI subunit B